MSRGVEPEHLEAARNNYVELSRLDEKIQGCIKTPYIFLRMPTPGKGNCYYNSIFQAIMSEGVANDGWLRHNVVESGGVWLRDLVAHNTNSQNYAEHWLRENVDMVAYQIPPIDSFLASLRDPYYWADIYIISWTMSLLGISCTFYDVSTNQLYCGVKGINPDAHVLIAWVQHKHFETMGVYDPVTRVFKKVFSPDDPIIQEIILLAYESDCADATIHDALPYNFLSSIINIPNKTNS